MGCALETSKGKKEAERKSGKKQMRERLVEAERVKKQGQVAFERKGGDKEGKRGVETSDVGRQDWGQQAVQRQMALAEQRESHRIDERRIEYREAREDEQGIGEGIRLSEGMNKGNDEHEGRNAIIEEKGSCFQPSSKADGDLGEGKLQKTARMLEERMEEMNSRIRVLEGNSDGEEKETSSSDGDMIKIGDGTTAAGGFGHL